MRGAGVWQGRQALAQIRPVGRPEKAVALLDAASASNRIATEARGDHWASGLIGTIRAAPAAAGIVFQGNEQRLIVVALLASEAVAQVQCWLTGIAFFRCGRCFLRVVWIAFFHCCLQSG